MSYRVYPVSAAQVLGGLGSVTVSGEGSVDVEVGNDAADASINHIEENGISLESIKDAVEVGAKVAATAACAALTAGAGTLICGAVATVVLDFVFGTIIPAIGDLFNPDKEAWEKYNRRQAELAAKFGTQEKINEAMGIAYAQWSEAIESLSREYFKASGGQDPGYVWVATALKDAGAMMETDPHIMLRLDSRNRPATSTDAGYVFSCGTPVRWPVLMFSTTKRDMTVKASSGLCMPQFDARWYEYRCNPQDPLYAKTGGPPSWCKPGASTAEQTAYGRTVVLPMIQEFFDRLQKARVVVALEIANKFAAQVAVREARAQHAKIAKPSGKKPPSLGPKKGWGIGVWIAIAAGGGYVAYRALRSPRS